MNGDGLRALEAVRPVAEEYGIPAAELKPCIAVILDGNTGASARHDCAFTIAADLRRIGFDENEVDRIARRWARKIGYSQHNASRAARDAFKKKPNGDFRYHPPGRIKKVGGRYHAVLAAVCEDVGCPPNCAPLSRRRRHPNFDEDFARFVELGWPDQLRSLRMRGAVDTYRGICKREIEIEWSPGEPFFASHQQLSDLTDHGDRKAVARHLLVLSRLGLITYIPGCGEKGRRRASEIARVVPIPQPNVGAITTGGATCPDTAGAAPSDIGDASLAPPTYSGFDLPAVTVLADGRLDWRHPPQAGEAGVLADLEALVAVGIAEWTNP